MGQLAQTAGPILALYGGSCSTYLGGILSGAAGPVRVSAVGPSALAAGS